MIYWISTGIVVAFLALSAFSYLLHQSTIQGIRDLGFPDFFRIQLAVLKLLAIPALLIPGLPIPAREWAYAGVALFILTAIIAHQAHHDPIALNIVNLLLLSLLVVSYMQQTI